MNQLVNIIYLATGVYFGLPRLFQYSENPIIRKVLFVASGLILQLLFDILNNIIKKEKIKLYKIIDKPLMKSLLLLLGLMLYTDIKSSSELLNKIPGLSEVINNNGVSVIFIILPLFVVITGKCLLRPI
jgi:hypothetical protein|uniref:Uncharacterized protein n=1 Tax=viral metagenome TaxID=1070528 RepID=A0A6C0IT18_9ZZZZ